MTFKPTEIAAALGALALLAGASPALAWEARTVTQETVVAAPVAEVWTDWSTLEGLRNVFVTPTPLQGKVEPRPGGAYQLLFVPDNAPGSQGTEGAQVTAVQAERMIAFTWPNPPTLPMSW
jgi:uncharacterized protein YndB with AHSA1/START domain